MKTLTLLTWITAFQALIGVFVKLTDSRGPVQTFTAQAMAFNPALFFVVRADIRRHGMIDGGRNRLQLALAAPFISFPLLYPFAWNPIYPGIVAMAIGVAATIACQPDLARRIWFGGVLFIGYYGVFLLGLEWSAPGYIGRVWAMDALSGIQLGAFPLEEFLFAAGFGGYWSAVCEHFTWRASAARASARSAGNVLTP